MNMVVRSWSPNFIDPHAAGLDCFVEVDQEDGLGWLRNDTEPSFHRLGGRWLKNGARWEGEHFTEACSKEQASAFIWFWEGVAREPGFLHGNVPCHIFENCLLVIEKSGFGGGLFTIDWNNPDELSVDSLSLPDCLYHDFLCLSVGGLEEVWCDGVWTQWGDRAPWPIPIVHRMRWRQNNKSYQSLLQEFRGGWRKGGSDES